MVHCKKFVTVQPENHNLPAAASSKSFKAMPSTRCERQAARCRNATRLPAPPGPPAGANAGPLRSAEIKHNPGTGRSGAPVAEMRKMQCKVRWTGGGGMSFLAETGSGHAVVMDGAPEGGGNNLAPRPMEMVLLGTGGCTAYDVVLILRKSGQPISGCEVRLEAERAEADPKVFTKIHLHFLVSGVGLRPNLVEHAIRRSHEKYCSATAMLASTAEITTSWEIVAESN